MSQRTVLRLRTWATPLAKSPGLFGVPQFRLCIFMEPWRPAKPRGARLTAGLVPFVSSFLPPLPTASSLFSFGQMNSEGFPALLDKLPSTADTWRGMSHVRTQASLNEETSPGGPQLNTRDAFVILRCITLQGLERK
ncbi:hypothetical protein SKAU_G00168700 [Synaphobranchus kaupii]|uniref:Uncharacterized protein n=1 Tax=Synaphobranchus kaupii TaxID=118154 RepID=A0A9Q1J0H6_SYNKA|nr:hypothetical protein SKAU_G00168700 [Synaphobranchus kaupii]